jgi:hypothetical protein
MVPRVHRKKTKRNTKMVLFFIVHAFFCAPIGDFMGCNGIKHEKYPSIIYIVGNCFVNDFKSLGCH